MISPLLQHLKIPFDKKLYDGLIGNYQSVIKGQWTDYHWSRPYDISDHPKHIDRKNTAKKNQLYTKEYHEEQQIHIVFVLDRGFSMGLSLAQQSKRSLAHDITNIITSIVIQQQDCTSILLYDQSIQDFFLQQSWQALLSRSIALMHQVAIDTINPTHTQSDLTHTLHQLQTLINQPSHIIIIWDDYPSDALPLLQWLSNIHHLSMIHINSPWQASLEDDRHITTLAQRQHQLRWIGIHTTHISDPDDTFYKLATLWTGSVSVT